MDQQDRRLDRLEQSLARIQKEMDSLRMAGAFHVKQGRTIIDGTVEVGGATTLTAALVVGGATTLTGAVTLGTDVGLSRGAANRLDLASGDSLNIVSGALQVGGTTVVSSARAITAAGLTMGDYNIVGNYFAAGIEDNEILEITPENAIGVILIYARHTSCAGHADFLNYRTSATAFCVSMTGTMAGIATALSAGAPPTGGGTDGVVNVSTYGSVITVKNCLGTLYSVGWVFFGI